MASSVSAPEREKIREWSTGWRVMAERYIAQEKSDSTRLINGSTIKVFAEAVITYDDLVRRRFLDG
jgi:hypothetical protein